MNFVSYNGYGIDLGDFKSKDELINQVVCTFLDNADEYTDDINDALVATACETDAFKTLVYIPSVIPVATDSAPIKVYTKQEANDTLVNQIMDLFKDIINEASKSEDMQLLDVSYLDNYDLKQFDYDKCRKEVTKFVTENADYSYNHNWSEWI